VRAELNRLLPGRGGLAGRYAAFDSRFVVAPDRLAAVVSRAISECREATRAHVALPPNEGIEVEYVHDLPWSAFTRYEGNFKSRVTINAGLAFTVDRVVDLACHETYPGHHTISTLLDQVFGRARTEFLVEPRFSPQSALHEAVSSVAPHVVFSDASRLQFERDVLFPLAGADAADAVGYARVCRLMDALHDALADVARRFVDGALDFPRASAALEQDALMTSPDATLKFLNQYGAYAATYTAGRDRVDAYLDAHSRGREDGESRWRALIALVKAPAQVVPADRMNAK
jgi:hypothetical protein